MSVELPKRFAMYGKNRKLRHYLKKKINNNDLRLVEDYALALSHDTTVSLQLTKDIFDKAPGIDHFFQTLIHELLIDYDIESDTYAYNDIRYKMRWTEYLPIKYLQGLTDALYKKATNVKNKQDEIGSFTNYAVHVGYSWCKKFHRDISRFRVWVFANDKKLCNQYQNYGKQIKLLCKKEQLPCLRWMYPCTEDLSDTAAFFMSINYLEAQVFAPHVVDDLYNELSTQTRLLMNLNQLSTAV